MIRQIRKNYPFIATVTHLFLVQVLKSISFTAVNSVIPTDYNFFILNTLDLTITIAGNVTTYKFERQRKIIPYPTQTHGANSRNYSVTIYKV
jgi:hypothetical protein